MKKEIGQKEFENLAHAVGSYIKIMGGHALVIGGISLEKRGNLKNNFTLRVDFSGKAPTKKV